MCIRDRAYGDADESAALMFSCNRTFSYLDSGDAFTSTFSFGYRGDATSNGAFHIYRNNSYLFLKSIANIVKCNEVCKNCRTFAACVYSVLLL